MAGYEAFSRGEEKLLAHDRISLFFSFGDVVFVLASSVSDDLEPNDANGEKAEVFKKLFGKDDYFQWN